MPIFYEGDAPGQGLFEYKQEPSCALSAGSNVATVGLAGPPIVPPFPPASHVQEMPRNELKNVAIETHFPHVAGFALKVFMAAIFPPRAATSVAIFAILDAEVR